MNTPLTKQVIEDTGLDGDQVEFNLNKGLYHQDEQLPELSPKQRGEEEDGFNVAERVKKLFSAAGTPRERLAIPVVRQILAQEVDVNAKNSVGQTLLHVAAFWSGYEMVKLLLSFGADVNARDKDQRTPLQVAAEAIGQDPRIARLLLEVGADIDIYAACMLGDLQQVWALIRDDPLLVKARMLKGWYRQDTPLHKAAKKGHLEVAELLLQRGAEVDAQTCAGETPLHWAAEWNHVAVVGLLLIRGADPRLHNRMDATPMDVAVANNGREAAVIELLRKYEKELP